MEKGQLLVNALLSGYSEVAPLPAAYEKWGDLFEMAAALFKLDFRAARVVQRGTTLQERELHIVSTLSRGLERIDL